MRLTPTTRSNGAVPPTADGARDETTHAGTLYLVHVLTHSTRARLDGLLVPLGLSSFHYTILAVIDRNPGLSAAALSRRFHVTPQAMGEVILSLDRRSLITRSPGSGTSRTLHLELTAAGAAVRAAAEAIVSDFERAIFADRSTAEMKMFRAFLSATLAGLRDRQA